MSASERRSKLRRILIISLSASTAGLTAVLALFQKNLGQGLAVFLGYVILLMSSVLMNVSLSGSTYNTKRTALLVFSLGVLVFFLGGIAYILFLSDSDEDGETSPVREEQADVLPVIGGADGPTEIVVFEDIAETEITPTAEKPHTKQLKETYEEAEPFSIPSAPDLFFTVYGVETETVISLKGGKSQPAVPEAPDALSETVSIPEDVTVIELQPRDEKSIILPPEEDKIEPVPAEPETEELSADSFFSGMTQEEADFWATFYIAGEDELELEDGTYYMDLSINENYTGPITVYVQDGEPSLSVAELGDYLSDTITDEAFDRIFTHAGETLPLSSLEECGIGVSFDSVDYKVGLSFDPGDMPVQILSISGSSGVRRRSRPISDGMDIEPASFTLASSYSLSGRMSDFLSARPLDRLDFTFSSSNEARLYDLYLDFNYYMNFGIDYFRFAIGSYRFRYDIPEALMRLTWGNVSSDLLNPRGTSIGVRFDRSYSYAPEGYRRPSQHEQLLVIDKPSEVQILNEGREIFRRTLDVGTYRLRDFVLYSGANRITIRISPLDGSETEEIDLDILYSSSLLAPGEVYYGASLVTGRRLVNSSSAKAAAAFRIPLWNGRSIEYDLRDLVLSSYLRTGLTSNLTMDTTLALQNSPSEAAGFRPNMKLAMEFTHANVIGTTRYGFNVTEKTDADGTWNIPGIYANIGHQIQTGWVPLSSISLGANYSSPHELNVADRHRIGLNASVSGRLGIMGWTLSASGSLYTDNIDRSSWSVSASANVSISRDIWLS